MIIINKHKTPDINLGQIHFHLQNGKIHQKKLIEVKLKMCPHDTDTPTFPSLSHFRTDGWIFLCFRFMSYFYCSFLL